ncbi:DUF1330 domain-containing protein [Rhizobium terrae]|uniref:hypothetical protein n=1 Tax=Rhizobium terrae TaxID=2171756 RepID=UPI001D03071F|nr:hypothetical protein [Rhizobium terrae]
MDVINEASHVIGSGPVVMVNLLSFHEQPVYSESFPDKKTSVRSAYYEGYAGVFREIAAQLQITTELVYAGRWLHGVLAAPQEAWHDIVIVRYKSFDDLRRILDHPDYATRAAPHRHAAVADWRFIATRNG